MTVRTEAHIMEYRALGGQTGLQISRIGFGASPLGDVFGAMDPAPGKLAVHLAIDSGINFFDVSPYYGLTLAEERLGEALVGKRHKSYLPPSGDATAPISSIFPRNLLWPAWRNRCAG
jgi:hypothetical protein